MKKTLSCMFMIQLVLCSASAGENAKDPWAGFGLDSWVKIRETRKQTRAGKTEEQSSVQTFRVNSCGSSASVAVTDDDGKSSVRHHVHGGTPEQLGLEKATSGETTLSIAGKEHAALVTEYVSTPGDKRLELMTKPFPEIMKQGELKGEKDVTVRLKLWTVKGADVPYRELTLPGLDLALGPEVVKLEHQMLRTDPQGNALFRQTTQHLVQQLAKSLQVGDQTITCVQQHVSGSQEGKKPDGTASSVTFEGTELLSNAVPGRVVSSSVRWRSGDDSGANEKQALSFHTESERDYGQVEFPPMKERPVIPGGNWGNLHLGAWQMSFTFNIFPENKNAFGSVSRVVAVRPNGSLIIENRSIDGNARIDEPSYQLREAGQEEDSLRGKDSLASGAEDITLAEKPQKTKWRVYRHVYGGTGGEMANVSINIRWEPAADDTPAPPGGVFQQFEYDLTHDSYSAHRSCKLSRLIGKDFVLNLGGAPRTCTGVLSYGLQGDDKKYKYESWEIELHAADVPGGTLVRLQRDMHNRGISYTLQPAWGEHETACPANSEEIAALIRATSPEVSKVLKELDSRIDKPEFRAQFLKDLQAIEKRALELDQEHPREKTEAKLQ
jgi:hypothetical protein